MTSRILTSRLLRLERSASLVLDRFRVCPKLCQNHSFLSRSTLRLVPLTQPADYAFRGHWKRVSSLSQAAQDQTVEVPPVPARLSTAPAQQATQEQSPKGRTRRGRPARKKRGPSASLGNTPRLAEPGKEDAKPQPTKAKDQATEGSRQGKIGRQSRTGRRRAAAATDGLGSKAQSFRGQAHMTLHAIRDASNAEVQYPKQLSATLCRESLKSFARLLDLPGPTAIDLQKAQDKVGYVFKQPDLLRLAFLHGTPALDTMSWVGDSLLYFLLTEQLPARYPNATLKSMHEAREKLLSRNSCALRARKIGLDEFIVYDAGLRGQPFFDGSPSVNLAGELFEAVLGAVYLDGGMTAGRGFFQRNYKLPDDIADIPLPVHL